jgi:hypothetical protein
VSTTEERGKYGLDDGTYDPTLGDGASAFLQHTVFCHTIGPLRRCGSARRPLLPGKNLLMTLEVLAGDATLVASATGVASACSGLSCHTLPTLTSCPLSPSVAGGGPPGHASGALQPLDAKAPRARPADWHGLCSLRA